MSYQYNTGPQSIRHYSPNNNHAQYSNNGVHNQNQGYNYPTMDNQPVPDHLNNVNNYSPPSYYDNNRQNYPVGQAIINPVNQQNDPLILDRLPPPAQFKNLLNGVLILLFINCLIALAGFLISLLLVLDANGNSILNFKILYMMILGGELCTWMSAFLVAKQTETKPNKLMYGRILIFIATILIIAGYIIYFNKKTMIAVSLYMGTYIIIIKVIASMMTLMMYIIYSRRRNEAIQ